MQRIRLITAVLVITLIQQLSFAQSGILDPNDPDLVFTTTNRPAIPTYNRISKWGHTNRLSWNPYNFGYKSYYFKGMAFRLKFPKTYAHNVADGKVYPAIVFLHGLGEPGTVYDNEFHLVHGGQTHAQKINDGTYDGFMIYPQSQAGYLQSYFPILKDLVDSLVKYVKLDIDRINVGGLSSGGQAVWDFPQQQQYAKIIAGIEPISAAQYEDVNYFASHITVPVFVANGGQDRAPYPSTVTDIINSYKNLGGKIEQAYFASQGHGAWNSFWADPRYWPFINSQHKANPLVYFQRSKFCPNESVNTKLGLQAGFAAYEWEKDGVVIAGQNSKDLTVTSYGTYRGRFKRTATGAWSAWSPNPVVISENTGTISPSIELNDLASNVLPAPDGNTTAPLSVPNTFFTYEWRRVSDNALVSSSYNYNAPVGQYKVKVTEQYGCGSDFSEVYTVVPANGINKPDPATSASAIAVSNSSVQIDWNDNPSPTYNEAGFEIYRSTSTGTGYNLVGKTTADILTFLDQGLSANTQYFYVIRAINETAASAVSSEVKATTKSDVSAPSAPANLRVTGSSRSSVSLAWDFSTDDVEVTKYEIYVNGVKSYVTSNTAFTVNGLSSLSINAFYIKAVDASGNLSPASNQVSGTAALTGLSYKYYHGVWSVLPDFNALTPLSTGSTPNVNLTPRQRDDNFGFLWEGYINIPVSGSYTFETNSDDGSKLYIGQYSHTATPLVNNDGLHGGQFRAGTITLTAGSHPIAITFFERTGGQGMSIYWTSVAAGVTTRTLIPNSAFSDNVTVTPSQLPIKPANLLVEAISFDKVNLTWNDLSNNETGFEVSRSTSMVGTYVNIGTTAADVTSFVDSVGVSPNTKYWYKIRAVNQFGQSEVVSILEAKWDFNNSYNDGSGNNRNLTGSSSPTFNSTDKKEGSHAISLNGSNQYLNLPFATSRLFPANSYDTRTVGVWIKPISTAITSANKIIYDFGGSDNGISLRFNSGSLQAGIASANVRSTVILNGVISNPNWVVGGWNHVGVVYNVNIIQLYLNGVLVGSTNLTFSSVGNSTNGSRIGASNSTNAFNSSSSATNYGGLLDEFVIIKEPLNASGLQALMVQSYSAGTSFTLPNVPADPTNLIAKEKTANTITLEFNDNSSNESYFEVYRSASNLNNYRLLTTINGGSGSTKAYLDENLFPNSNYYYKVRAVGVGGTTQFTSDLLIRTDNNPPVLAALTSTTMRHSSQKNVNIVATDLDVESVVISFAEPLPTFAVFNSTGNGIGTLQFSPSEAEQGVYPITVIATDANGGTDTEIFTLTVNNNYTPVITPLVNTSISENNSTTFNLNATDEDGNNSLVWTITSPPSFVSLTDNGSGSAVLNIAPGFAHAGSYPLTLMVSDGAGANETSSFVLTVTNLEPPLERWLISTKYNSANAPAPWNTISSVNTATGLKNELSVTTSVGIEFVGTNWNAGDAGAVTGNNSGVYPDAVIKDYFWFGVYGAPNTVNVNLKGLTPGAKYNVTLFGSSAWRGLGNNGTTVYSINGVSKPLYVDNNNQNTVTFSSITANVSGIITFNMSKGSDAPYGLVNAIVLEKPFDDGTSPIVPTNLSAQSLPDGTVKLRWVDIAYNEGNYLISRSNSADGEFALLNPTSSNANDSTFIDNTVQSNVTYFYKVEATNENGSSGFSNLAEVTTSNKAPLLGFISDVYVRGGNTANIVISPSDDVNDVLTTTINGLPTFATFEAAGNGAGTIQLNPPADLTGVFSGIEVKVVDNSGASISRYFTITVTDNSVRSAYVNLGPDGATPQPAPWNNYIGYPFNNYSYGNIRDDQNVITGFSFKTLSQWNGGLSFGLRTGNNTGVFPDNVMRTSWHNYNAGTHTIQFDGLNPSKRYSIGFLTNSNTGANSTVTFSSQGKITVIDGRYNTNSLANMNGLVPSASGIIQVAISKDAANQILSINGIVIREYNSNDPLIRPADLFTELLLQSDRIRLKWSDRSDDETGFEILRSTSVDGNYSLVGTTSANVSTFTDIGLLPNVRYYYKVRSVNTVSTSLFSASATGILSSNIVLINQNVDIAQKAPAPWNSTSSPSTVGATFSNLINTNSINSGYEMVITKDFNGAGFAGVNVNGLFPANVMVSNYWTDAGQTSEVRFQNLDVSKKYRIGCFGSNLNTTYATANYSINGKTVELNSYYNDLKVVYLEDLVPGQDGDLVLSVATQGGSPYSFTGAYTIEAYTDPELTIPPVVNTISQSTSNSNLLAIANVAPPVKATINENTSNIGNTKAANVEGIKNLKVYPNPFINIINFEFLSIKSANIQVMLYDRSGRLLYTKNDVKASGGNNRITMTLPTGLILSPGIYILNIWVDGKLSKTTQMVKVN